MADNECKLLTPFGVMFMGIMLSPIIKALSVLKDPTAPVKQMVLSSDLSVSQMRTAASKVWFAKLGPMKQPGTEGGGVVNGEMGVLGPPFTRPPAL